MVSIDLGSQPPVPENEVQAQVVLGGGFPFQVLIFHLVGTHAGKYVVAIGIIGIGDISAKCVVVANFLVTGQAKAVPEFKVV